MERDTMRMEHAAWKAADRIYLGEKSGEPRWNFARYTPHVVVVAIGQNDAWPEDIMKNDYYGEQAQQWREHL